MAYAKVFECLVCREIYDDQNLCSRMLSCGHSFCTRCLNRLFTEKRDQFCCPTAELKLTYLKLEWRDYQRILHY